MGVHSSSGDPLFDSLMAEVDRYIARAEARRKAVTPESWPAYQEELRQKFLRMIGPLPEPTPLRSRVTGELERDGYKVEKVLFESRPDFPVTANLYLPETRDGRVPGILFPCGHSVEGKAHPTYQAACQGLARYGFAVLVYDPVGQGERSMYVDPNTAVDTVPRGTTQHGVDGNRCTMLGTSLATWRLWDGICALEYLIARPEVDPDRIGCTGNSGGGTLTTYLCAVEERIRVAVPGCYITTFRHRFRSRVAADPEQNLIPTIREGIDHFEMLALFAPRPLLIAAATQDFFPIEGTRETYSALLTLYKTLGCPERVALAEVDAPHGFSRPLREEMYGWMNRWLREDGRETRRGGLTEPEIEPEPEEALWCTPKGQVLVAPGGETVFRLTCAEAAHRRPAMPAFTAHREAPEFQESVRDTLRQLAALQNPALELLERGEVSPGGSTELRYRVEPGSEVRATLLLPREPAKRVVLWIAEEGRQADGERIRAAARIGAVLAIDPRGMGETRPPGAADDPQYYGTFGPEYDLTYLSFMLGRPLVGLRLMDVLGASQLLRELPETRELPITLYGTGMGGVLAVMAGALAPEVGTVEMEGALLSYRAYLRSAKPAQHVNVVLPGAEATCDLPAIAGAIAPRAFVLTSPVDASGLPATLEAAVAEYELTARLYVALGAQGRFRIDISRESGSRLGSTAPGSRPDKGAG
jgi:cephalosporin-C deacetylase-like acetyl esterase